MARRPTRTGRQPTAGSTDALDKVGNGLVCLLLGGDGLHDIRSLRPLDFSHVWQVLPLLVRDPCRRRRARSKRGLCQSSTRNPRCCGTRGCCSRTRTQWSKRVVRSRGQRCTTKFLNQLAFLASVYWYRVSSWLLRLVSFALSFEPAIESPCARCWAKDCL